MSTTYTTNYHLGKQEDTSDNFNMSVITENMDIIDTALSGKQATLTTTQLSAVNSGIDSTKVAQIETNKNNILLKANTSDVNTAINGIEANLEDISYTINHLTDEITNSIDVEIVVGKYVSDSVGVGKNWKNHLVTDSYSQYTETAYQLEDRYVGNTLEITVSSYGSTSTRCMGFCDENDIVSSFYYERDAGWVANGDGTYTAKLPIVTPYFFISLKKSSTITNIKASYIPVKINDKIAYVSPRGSDDNSGGTMADAYATVTKAIKSGCSRIILDGGYYNQSIDLSAAKGKHIEIESFDRTSRPVFADENCVISESAELNNGIYSCAISQTISAGNVWLYLDGVADEETEITDSDRMPLQRGKSYRCDDTRIIKCSSSALSDALEEMRASDAYKWFKNEGTLYFTAPSAPTSEHPICCSNGNPLFVNADRSMSLTINGIECKYIELNVKNMCDVFLADCKASNVFGWGAITFGSTLNAKFLRCEASRCVNSTNGDGFNADVSNEGDPFAKHYTASLIDCWSHDNADDGYSCHRKAESTIIGGLYENNGKAGVTPSYGEHCSCYNVYSRKNYSGFLCTGDVEQAEGGKYTQMLCSNCVAENNTRGGLRSGFGVNGAGNKMILVGCKAISNNVSYYVANNSFAKLIDCTTYGAETVIGGTPDNAEILSTTVVTT